jgi:hypothetical protein
MKKLILSLAAVSMFSFAAPAQTDEIGLFMGMAKYKGELSNSFFTLYFLSPAFGAYYRHNFNRYWSARMGATIGSISGDDSYSRYDYEVNRNLSFSSAIQEVSATFEFNFLPFELGNYNYTIAPYMFWGASVFHFNPKADYKGYAVELQPLGTEGQETYTHPERKKYSLISAAMPFGGGFKINGDNIGFTIEIGPRRTYTDYLDDVSMTYSDKHTLLTENGSVAAALSDRSLGNNPLIGPDKMRGDPMHPDWYMFVGASAYINIGGKFRYSCKPFNPSRLSR